MKSITLTTKNARQKEKQSQLELTTVVYFYRKVLICKEKLTNIALGKDWLKSQHQQGINPDSPDHKKVRNKNLSKLQKWADIQSNQSHLWIDRSLYQPNLCKIQPKIEAKRQRQCEKPAFFISFLLLRQVLIKRC